jgi:hypothetical protein
MTDYKALIKSLSKKQRAVLDQICIGNDKSHSRITLQSLIRKGLIVEYTQKLNFMCGISRYEFASLAVHIAWCEVCAEENPKGLEVGLYEY